VSQNGDDRKSGILAGKPLIVREHFLFFRTPASRVGLYSSHATHILRNNLCFVFSTGALRPGHAGQAFLSCRWLA
jgi:hypothetical protein